ncbi:MAG: epoxyqueuosine reductase [Bacillota bacterium]
MKLTNWLEKVKLEGLKVGILSEDLLVQYKRKYNRQLKNAGSLFVFLQPYPEIKPPKFSELDYKLKLSKYARGIDYHKILKNKLEYLSSYLINNPEIKVVWTGVDNHCLPEKKIAREAGLGRIGYNTLLINSEIGSYSFIGLMAVNYKFNINTTFHKKINCSSCKLCQEYCPGNALYLKDGIPYLNKDRCISYLTQKKGVLSFKEDKLIGNNFWGCDICQQVCPYNNSKDAQHSRIIAAKTWPGITKIDPAEIIKAYIDKKKLFSNYAFSWRGNRILVRNLLINLINIKTRHYSNEVQELNISNSPIIKKYLNKYNKEIGN